jgi:hypothetical protein
MRAIRRSSYPRPIHVAAITVGAASFLAAMTAGEDGTTGQGAPPPAGERSAVSPPVPAEAGEFGVDAGRSR